MTKNKTLSDKIVEVEMQYNRISKKVHLKTLDEISKIINCLDIFETINGELSEALDKVYDIVKNEYQIYNPKD
jgi:hypothetical protein